MAKLPPRPNNDLFTSVILEIKKYKGKDPLLPWLRGIKKMKESLTPQILKEKLPRFLQKCAQTFLADQRYRNDLRFVRVWIQLMDFVDDPRALLKTMETNHIGTKQAVFYQAYALYFVKLKKFEEADNMYHLGVQNLAEPAGELQKSYEQFLCRMEQYKKKRTRHQEARASRSTHSYGKENQETKQDSGRVEGGSTTSDSKPTNNPKNYVSMAVVGAGEPRHTSKQRESIGIEPDKANTFCSDETVFNFVDTAIVGKSEAEDACHHGLVEPTINMKEAMNAINNMFREPIELEALHRRKSHRTQTKVTDQKMSSGFEVFVDEDLDKGMGVPDQSIGPGDSPSPCFITGQNQTETESPPQETFQIFVDDEYDNECSDGLDDSNIQNAFVFPKPKDLLSNRSEEADMRSSPILKFREDTVVGRFVGSAILEDPEVENACHHGLVDPTINLKEAMDAINSMFGKPLDFAKTSRSKNPGKPADKKIGYGGFSILADEELESHHPPPKSSYASSKLSRESDLFEPTINTKKAMDDINEMFGMPLDF